MLLTAQSESKAARVLVYEAKSLGEGVISRCLAAYVGGLWSSSTEAEFRSALSENNPDFILVCLEGEGQWPKRAIDLLGSIRADDRWDEFPILACVGDHESSVLNEAILAGADAFVTLREFQQNWALWLMTMSRARQLRIEALRGKQFQAVQLAVGPIKHELANSLTVVSALVFALTTRMPQLEQDVSVIKLKDRICGMIGSINKLNALREPTFGLPCVPTKKAS